MASKSTTLQWSSTRTCMFESQGRKLVNNCTISETKAIGGYVCVLKWLHLSRGWYFQRARCYLYHWNGFPSHSAGDMSVWPGDEDGVIICINYWLLLPLLLTLQWRVVWICDIWAQRALSMEHGYMGSGWCWGRGRATGCHGTRNASYGPHRSRRWDQGVTVFVEGCRLMTIFVRNAGQH